jgi:alanyl-tRNA synthetase
MRPVLRGSTTTGIGGRERGASREKGDPDVLEIWNHVLHSVNREQDASLKPLPARHVRHRHGTRAPGLVIQDKRSNYDTDLFTPIFAAIQKRTGARPYGASLTDHVDIAYRVIADHIRCLTVAISDGALPSNEGRGSVLRRILRRAVRHGHQTLGVRGAVHEGLGAERDCAAWRTVPRPEQELRQGQERDRGRGAHVRTHDRARARALNEAAARVQSSRER